MSRLKPYRDKRGNREKGIYEDPETGRKYVRVRENGRDTFKSCGSDKISVAMEAKNAREVAKTAARMGLAVEPSVAEQEAKKTAARCTIAEIVRTYTDAGYPDRKGIPKKADAKHKLAEVDYCDTLLTYFRGDGAAEDLDQDALDHYQNWRQQQVKRAGRRGAGHRITDLELNTLNSAMRWAVRKKLIKVNSIATRVRYYTPSAARHCREMSPASIDEVHHIAGLLFGNRTSEVLGWQCLYEALTGLRTEECLSLRMKARPDEPGGLTTDGRSLCVRRADKARNENPYVEVRPALKALRKAHKKWLKARYPHSPWYFPGRDGRNVVYKCALTRALDRLFRRKLLNKKFTSHGLRAFYVLIRRSQGASDTQIAVELNQLGGVKTLEDVYGKTPPHWLHGKAPRLRWIPKGKPAWSKIKPLDAHATLRASSGSSEVDIACADAKVGIG